MKRAIDLAREVMGTTSPNPPVGAVIVRNGRSVGEGQTQPPGEAHAEIVALRRAGEAARGSALYVTLEPCCHWGRTGPCTRAIIAAGVAEVHVATLDPFDQVSGRGIAELQAAGIRVAVGEGQAEAQELIAGFAKRHRLGLPLVIAKFAVSLDGKIATRSGSSQWITGELARAEVQRIRAACDAILVGVDTVIADDPRLSARPPDRPARYPLRVVADSAARTPPTAQLLWQPGRTLVATTSRADPGRLAALEAAGAEVLVVPPRENRVDLAAVLHELGRRGVATLLVEGGGRLLGSLFDEGLVDRVLAFIAPILIGGEAAPSPIGGLGIDPVSAAPRLDRVRVERFGDDVLISGYLCDLDALTSVQPSAERRRPGVWGCPPCASR